MHGHLNVKLVNILDDYSDCTHGFKYAKKIKRCQKLPTSSAVSQFICSDNANGFKVLLLLLLYYGWFRLHVRGTATSQVLTFSFV